jgi:hypothetical protein
MGTSISMPVNVNYEKVQSAISSPDYMLINTLGTVDQNCLIVGTLSTTDEVTEINRLMNNGDKSVTLFIVYGKNSSDASVYAKQNQLISAGFDNVFVYGGGMFEWLLLQDVYGESFFPTTSPEVDLLRFK